MRRRIPLPYFHRRSAATGKRPQTVKKRLGERRCYHHKRNEASLHRPRPGHWPARCRTHRRPARRCQCKSRRQCPRNGCVRGQPAHPPGCRHCRPKPRRRSGCRPRCQGRRTRRGRLFAPLSPRRRHPVARSHRRLLFLARSRLCSNPLANQSQLRSQPRCSRPRSQHLPARRRRHGGLSLSERQLVLARAEEVNCRVSVSSRRRRSLLRSKGVSGEYLAGPEE